MQLDLPQIFNHKFSSQISILNMKKLPLILLFSLLVGLQGCDTFLDAKPDKALATPETLADLAAMMDNVVMHTNYPVAGDIASDDYYMQDAVWEAITDQVARQNYVWDPTTEQVFPWLDAYNRVFIANVVLDRLEELRFAGNSLAQADILKGQALFYRAFNFYHLLQVYTLPYTKAAAGSLPGIVLKLKSDTEEPIARASVEKSYHQTISDLEAAAALLPAKAQFKTQPSKVAAFALLARIYLIMGDYPAANRYADAAIELQPNLTDYNAVSQTAANPFAIFHEEVILHATGASRGGVFNASRARIDTLLYKSYVNDDLRKVLYFRRNTDGTYIFKGDYGGRNTSNLFSGIATDELYLIRAETFVRMEEVEKGLADLNRLALKRWKTGTFVPYSTSNTANPLQTILTERRKELLFRTNIRWSDLRRFAADPVLAQTPLRKLKGTTYSLQPGDLHYAFLIPASAVNLSGLQQNSR